MRSNHSSASNVSLARHNQTATPDLLFPFGSAAGLFDDLSLSLSPFQLMERMQQDMDRLFSQVMGVPSMREQHWTNKNNLLAPRSTSPVFSPTVDVSETEQDYRIEIDLPGVVEDAIDVRIVESSLIVSAEVHQETNRGHQDQADRQNDSATNQEVNPPRQYHYRERRWGRFERVFHLPPLADEENIQADFSSGVLTLTIPKKPIQMQAPQGRRIAISAAESAPASDQPSASNTQDGAQNNRDTAAGNAEP